MIIIGIALGALAVFHTIALVTNFPDWIADSNWKSIIMRLLIALVHAFFAVIALVGGMNRMRMKKDSGSEN